MSSAGTGRARGKRRRGAYHHGALREALLDAAESVLADAGIEGFTLRECARRAGVSHGAPAHHFGDVRGLLSELAAESFEALDVRMCDYRAAAPPEAFEQLLATGLAYVDYALANRARFRLMFRSERLDDANERLVAAGRRCHRHLEETVAAANSDAGVSGAMLEEKAALAWSIVHGFANLMLDNVGFAEQVGDAPEGARAMVSRLIRLSRPGLEAGTVLHRA